MSNNFFARLFGSKKNPNSPAYRREMAEKIAGHRIRYVTEKINGVEEISCKTALLVGAFQALSIVPGTSRSGSTILGSMLLGLSRTAGAEFSFFMAIPVMLGASALKLLKFFMDGGSFTSFQVILLFVGLAVSYVVSYFSIEFLMSFVKKHSFSAFGVYRIALGIILLGYFAVKSFV